MRFGLPVSFTRTANGTTLAYQVLGDGPLDLVFLFGWPSHLALMWENPAFADFLHRLASFSRLILFDRTRQRDVRPRPTRGRPSRTGWTTSVRS